MKNSSPQFIAETTSKFPTYVIYMQIHMHMRTSDSDQKYVKIVDCKHKVAKKRKLSWSTYEMINKILFLCILLNVYHIIH